MRGWRNTVAATEKTIQFTAIDGFRAEQPLDYWRIAKLTPGQSTTADQSQEVQRMLKSRRCSCLEQGMAVPGAEGASRARYCTPAPALAGVP